MNISTPSSSSSSSPSLSQKSPFFDTLHIIGLTGGIASGKSTACNTLKEVGCSIVDADKLGHVAYLPGSDGYHQLIQEFGADKILSDSDSDTNSCDGSTPLPSIDRRKLGAIVFNNKDQMKKLTNIVWPIIAELARKKIDEIDQNNKRIIKAEYELERDQKDKVGDGDSSPEKPCKVVVIEAAILLEAGWDTSLVDEVWSLVVPIEIAIQRLQKRNSFSEEESRKRVESQMTNEERGAKSRVVIVSSETEEIVKTKVLEEFHALQSRLASERGFIF